MKEELQKAVGLVKEARHIGLILDSKASLDALLSSQVLLDALIGQEKRSGFFVPPSLSELENTEALHKLANAPLLPKEFIVSLDTKPASVTQLRYEKAEDHIDVIFSPESAPIRGEYITFREGGIRCDAAITLEIPDIESALLPGIDLVFLRQIPIINIDGDSENKRFGRANLVDPAKSSLSEIIFELLKELTGSQVVDSESATLLLGGILSKTHLFESSMVLPNTLAAASQLLGAGANYEQALRIAQQTPPVEVLQLLGRALVRSREEGSPSVFWSFLTTEDFQKTGVGQEKVMSVLGILGRQFPRQQTHVLIWQFENNGKIFGMIRSSPQKVKKIEEEGSGVARSSSLLVVHEPFEDFREAEEKIASLLGNVL